MVVDERGVARYIQYSVQVHTRYITEETRTGSSTVRGKYVRYLVQVRTTTPRKEYGLERVRNLVMYVHYTTSIVHVESYTYLVREK